MIPIKISSIVIHIRFNFIDFINIIIVFFLNKKLKYLDKI